MMTDTFGMTWMDGMCGDVPGIKQANTSAQACKSPRACSPEWAFAGGGAVAVRLRAVE